MRILSLALVSALGGCLPPEAGTADAVEEAARQSNDLVPYTVVADQHGCKWRLYLDNRDAQRVSMRRQFKPDGQQDCDSGRDPKGENGAGG